MSHLEIAEVVSVHCNIINYDYWQSPLTEPFLSEDSWKTDAFNKQISFTKNSKRDRSTEIIQKYHICYMI